MEEYIKIIVYIFAGIGAGIYKDADDAFKTLKHIATEKPVDDVADYKAAYELWKERLGK